MYYSILNLQLYPISFLLSLLSSSEEKQTMRLSSKNVVLFFTLSFFALFSSVFSTEAIRVLSPAPQPASSLSANSPSNSNDDSSSPSPSPLSSSPDASPTPSADSPSPDASSPSLVSVSQISFSPGASPPASSPSLVPVSQISSSPGASPPSPTSIKSLPAYDDEDEDDEDFPKASPLLSAGDSSNIPSASPSSLPWGLKDKDDVLQVLGIFIKQDIEFIEKQHEGLMKAQEDPKSFPEAASIPSTCIEHCSKDYATVMADFKKAEEDLLAKDFYFASEDITRVSSDIQACERCLHDMVKGDCPLIDINKKLKKHAAECLSALQFTS